MAESRKRLGRYFLQAVDGIRGSSVTGVQTCALPICWVFKSFLKVERDAPALVVLGSSFHQCGTTDENSVDCCTCTDGSAERHEDYRSAAFQTLEAGTFTYSFFSFYIYLLFIK